MFDSVRTWCKVINKLKITLLRCGAASCGQVFIVIFYRLIYTRWYGKNTFVRRKNMCMASVVLSKGPQQHVSLLFGHSFCKGTQCSSVHGRAWQTNGELIISGMRKMYEMELLTLLETTFKKMWFAYDG